MGRFRYTSRPLFAVFALFSLFTVVMLAACSGGSSGSTSSTATSTGSSSSAANSVNVNATDFQYQIDHVTVSAGAVHFTFQNQSKTYQHEMRLYPQTQPKLKDLIAQKDAGGPNNTVNDADFLQNIVGQATPQDPGKSTSFDATLQPGTYEMACFVTSNIGGKNITHYELGMHTIITVK